MALLTRRFRESMPFIKSDGQRRWYAVQTASGHENKVKEHIEKRIVTMGAQDRIFGVIVPEKMVTKVKDGKRVEKKEREYPGYVFVEMILDDDSWRVVREAPGVTKYVGAGKKPIPVQDAEIRKILRRQMCCLRRQRQEAGSYRCQGWRLRPNHRRTVCRLHGRSYGSQPGTRANQGFSHHLRTGNTG